MFAPAEDESAGPSRDCVPGSFAIVVTAMGIRDRGGASVLLIAAHDRPFMGELSVGPAPLLQVMPEPEATRTG
jgi:hypothetical protein